MATDTAMTEKTDSAEKETPDEMPADTALAAVAATATENDLTLTDMVDVGIVGFGAIMCALAQGMQDMSDMQIKMTDKGVDVISAGQTFSCTLDDVSSFSFLGESVKSAIEMELSEPTDSQSINDSAADPNTPSD